MKRIAVALIAMYALLWILKDVALPVGAAAVYSSRYMQLTIECDTAMEASWYYGQDGQISAEAETVQMLACHDYDKTRKVLLMSGLPESYLAWLGLKSLEIHQRPAEEFVEQHRFRER